MPAARHTIEPLELYASAIDTSDYVAALTPVMRRLLPRTGDLLDIGAGGGQIGAAIREPARLWTVVEPSATMRARLERFVPPPAIVASGWEQADLGAARHDTVLAATMPAYFDQPEAFFDRCRGWARHNVLWIVPAHAGPRGLCFAGCLPTAWHGEDETPGIDIVMRGLPAEARPHEAAQVEWTFSGIVPDLGMLSAYLADRLGWPPADPRRGKLLDHLHAQARPDPAGHRLDIARTSAVLVWRFS
ncbi:hypothetical protein BH11PSE3_BH11PSE3_27220 [soil metagenome]